MSTWKITPSRSHLDHSVIIGPYDEDFVEALKADIPAKDRHWLTGLKAWLIHNRVVPIARRVIDRFTPGSVVSQSPLTFADVVETARCLGEDATHEDILDGVLLGVGDVYGKAGVGDAVVVRRGRELLIVTRVEI